MTIMPRLTTEQWATLETHVLAIPELASLPHYPLSDPDRDHQNITRASCDTIADYMNSVSGNFYVWKTLLSLNTIYENGFDWVQVDNLTVGKARIWDWLFGNGGRAINPSSPNVRAGIEECWKGTSAMLAVRAAVLGHCKTNVVTVAESIFAVGSGTIDSPAVWTNRGTVDEGYGEVRELMMLSWQ
jgi:hypothetical protein